MLNTIRSNKGVTLIELLVASVIALICTGAALKLYVNQQKNWLAQENITDMQQNGRSALDEMVFHARQAGYQLPHGLQALYASNANPDSITFVYLKEPICEAELTDAMSQPTSDLEVDPTEVGCFDANLWAYIYDPAADDGEFFLISGVEQASGFVQHAGMPLSKAYPLGSELYTIEFVSFYIDNTTDSLHPRLMFQRFDQPNVYADNIEDLQFTFTLAHGVVVDSLVSAEVVREINIELVARSDRIDPARGEDYLRDTLGTTVYLRNMDF